MKEGIILYHGKGIGLSALAGLALCLQGALVEAQGLVARQPSQTMVEKGQFQRLQPEQRAKVTHNAYILGPGDRLKIELLDLPELSGEFTIGPDGTIYLPRLRALQVEGLTIEELRLFLTEQFSVYVRQPEVFITPVGYRPVRVYVGGEVARPGYYTISTQQRLEESKSGAAQSSTFAKSSPNRSTSISGPSGQPREQLVAPTLFDALKAAKGVTPFSQLGSVQITRSRATSQGGGKIQAKVNFLRFISNGDEEVNIRLYDDDAIFISRSKEVLREQLLTATRTNLSPEFIEVFVSGRVKEPGAQTLPQGASLNHAIASAGGPELLRGRVEFLRFTQEGTTDRRIFSFNPKSISGAYNNPILMAGDVVRINESLLSASLGLINEITTPVVDAYSTYLIYDSFKK